MLLDRVMVPNPPEYMDLSWAQFMAGYTAKILTELSPALSGSTTENQLKHLNRMATYGITSSLHSVLAFNAALFIAVENQSVSWVEWPKVEEFHRRHLEAIRMANSASGAARNPTANPDKAGKDDDKKKDKFYVSKDFMLTSKICMKFQHGSCEMEQSHDLDNGINVQHVCALCFKLHKVLVPDHGHKSCPVRTKPSFRPGGV